MTTQFSSGLTEVQDILHSLQPFLHTRLPPPHTHSTHAPSTCTPTPHIHPPHVHPPTFYTTLPPFLCPPNAHPSERMLQGTFTTSTLRQEPAPGNTRVMSFTASSWSRRGRRSEGGREQREARERRGAISQLLILLLQCPGQEWPPSQSR